MGQIKKPSSNNDVKEQDHIDQDAAHILAGLPDSAANPLCIVALGLALFDVYPQAPIRTRQRLVHYQRDSFRTDIQTVYALSMGRRLLGLSGWGTWEEQAKSQLPQGKEILTCERAQENSLSPRILVKDMGDRLDQGLLSTLSNLWHRSDESRHELLALAYDYQARLLSMKIQRNTAGTPVITKTSQRRF